MTEFYRNLWEKKLGKLEALRQAQLTMMRRYDPKSGLVRGQVTKLKPVVEEPTPTPQANVAAPLPPYFWAAFTLSGDWR
jgi:CHAT domain-containing protein